MQRENSWERGGEAGKEQKIKGRKKKKKRWNTFSSRQNEFAQIFIFIFWGIFAQKYGGIKEGKLITKVKSLKFP